MSPELFVGVLEGAWQGSRGEVAAEEVTGRTDVRSVLKKLTFAMCVESSHCSMRTRRTPTTRRGCARAAHSGAVIGHPCSACMQRDCTRMLWCIVVLVSRLTMLTSSQLRRIATRVLASTARVRLRSCCTVHAG